MNSKPAFANPWRRHVIWNNNINILHYLFHFFLLLCFSTSCSNSNQAETGTSTNTSPVVYNFIEDYYHTMSQRDWETYRSFFWEKATLTTVWQKPGEDSTSVQVNTIDDFIAQTPQGPDSQPIFEEKMLDAEIEVRGNLATVWARYAAKFGTEEDLMEWEGTDLFTLMQHQGQWRIVSLAFEADL